MQRLIHVDLRHCDIILEPAGHGLKNGVNYTQNPVAVLYGIHNHPQCGKIINLIDAHIMRLHFFVDAVKVLGTAVYICVDSRLDQLRTDDINNLCDILFPFCAFLIYAVMNCIIGIGIKITQRSILQLPFDLIYT